MTTTFFLTDSEPLETQHTPQLAPAQSVGHSPAMSLKNSYSSLLDSDSESIISAYSPPLSSAGSDSRRSFENFLNHHIPVTVPEDIFQGFNDIKFSGKKVDPASADQSTSSQTHAADRTPPPSALSNSKVFAAALGYESKRTSSSSGKRSASSPKFKMPRVFMPSRRPFSTEGLALGKLKILVAGDSGSGKTNLIKAIAQSSEHIVFVDDTPSPVVLPDVTDTNSSLYDNLDLRPERQHALSELLASTKPQHLFLDSSQSRRSSVSTSSELSALDRNVCFVDTIGYGSFSSATNCITPVLSYLESAFSKTREVINPRAAESLSILTSSSVLTPSSLTDVCVYCIVHRVKPIDVEYIKKLSTYVPVIPVISKSDLLPPKDVLELKLNILKELHSHHVKPFLFGATIEEVILHLELKLDHLSLSASNSKTSSENSHETISPDDLELDLFPAAVSSALAPDSEVLASVLMSSTYIPSLVTSELGDLAEHILSSHGAAWLRYSAGKKFLAWSLENHTKGTLYSQKLLNAPVQQPPSTASSHLDNALVPVTSQPNSLSHSPNHHGPPVTYCHDDTADFVLNLPEQYFETRQRAQQGTSIWVTKLSESAIISAGSSPTEITGKRPVLSLKTTSSHVVSRPIRSRSSRNNNDPLSTSPPRGPLVFKHSLSIMNLDPFNILDTTWMVFKWTAGTFGLFIGVKLVLFIHDWIFAPPQEVPEPPRILSMSEIAGRAWDNLLQVTESLKREIQNPGLALHHLWARLSKLDSVISRLLASLGGGWSNLV